MFARLVSGRRGAQFLITAAMVLVTTAAPARPQGVAVIVKAGQALEDAGKLDQAIAEYGKAIAAAPASAEGWLRRGTARVKARAFEPALQDLDRSIQIDPANAEAQKSRAAALIGLLRFKEAVEAATRSVQIDPAYSPGYYQRAFAKFRLNDYAGCVEDETRAISAKPDNWDAFRIRGVAYVELKRHREALADLDTYFAHNADGAASTYHYRAIARHALGDSKGALEDETRALELNPSYAKGYAGLGIYKAALGDRAGAEAAFKKALALDPGEGAAKAGLAKLGAAGAVTAGSPPAVPSSARAAALPALDPSEVSKLSSFPNEVKLLAAFRAGPTPEARGALARVRFEHALRLAQTAERQRDEQTFRTALGYSESAVQLAPDNPAAWLLLGRLYAAIEENPVAADMAEQAFRAALEVQPDLAAARLGLGQLYARKGSFDRALNDLEPAVSAEPALATPEVVSMMGWAYIYDFQIDRGIACFRDLAAKQPKAEAPAVGLAALLHESGAQADATRVLKTLVESRGTTSATRAYANALLAEWAKGGAR
jgi:tetratricopeptide (TPR) repeat protein